MGMDIRSYSLVGVREEEIDERFFSVINLDEMKEASETEVGLIEIYDPGGDSERFVGVLLEKDSDAMMTTYSKKIAIRKINDAEVKLDVFFQKHRSKVPEDVCDDVFEIDIPTFSIFRLSEVSI
jgi:hypothetical protein